ncbi:hypothetical protein [Methylomagnum ishizawai]|uniref:hypothetical protein n=1 Tax=Methylomagnum ishizawai TaxID=1760988 RepID=UPI000F74994A|nr:hypothetical protein [Methylomagnum ishizawai]
MRLPIRKTWILPGWLKKVSNQVFRWSVPGSVQIGLLLSQGSEFAFVIVGLPAVGIALGDSPTAVLIAGVALSLALTPMLASGTGLPPAPRN